MGEVHDLMALRDIKLRDLIGSNMDQLAIERAQSFIIEFCRQVRTRWAIELVWDLQVRKAAGEMNMSFDGKTEADRERWSALLRDDDKHQMIDWRPLGRHVK